MPPGINFKPQFVSQLSNITYNFQDKDKIMKYEFLETEDYENKTVSLEVDQELESFIQFDPDRNVLEIEPKD